jgi:hypothetical protein
MLPLITSAMASLQRTGRHHVDRDLGVGHHRGALRNLLRLLEELARTLGRRIAEIPPDRRLGRDDVRLLAAVGDRAVRGHRRQHVFAVLRDPHVHQHNRVERVATFPRPHRGMRRLTGEIEGRRDHGRLQQAVRRRELAVDVVVERHVDVVEVAVTHEVGPAQELLFRRCTDDLDRPGQAEAFHRVAHGERRTHHHRAVDVVTFAVPGRIGDDLGLRGDAGGLRVGWVRIVLAVDRDHRRPASVRRDEGGWKSGDSALDFEAVRLEERRHESGGATLLHT